MTPDEKLEMELLKLKKMGVRISCDLAPGQDEAYTRAVSNKIIEVAKKLDMYDEKPEKTGTGYVVPVIIPHDLGDKGPE